LKIASYAFASSACSPDLIFVDQKHGRIGTFCHLNNKPSACFAQYSPAYSSLSK
jgi:hypothetical protein